MSVIFNNTFSSDKPIYYPSNWQSGKTSLQQYEQFKQTFIFYLLRNFIEILLSTLWVFVIFVIGLGIKEIVRLRKQDDRNLEKITNRKYIDDDFLFGVCGLAFIIGVMSAVVLAEEWGRIVLLKGVVSFVIVYFTRHQINKGISFFFKILSKIFTTKKDGTNKILHQESESQIKGK